MGACAFREGPKARSWFVTAALACAALAASGPAATAREEKPGQHGPLRVVIERLGSFYYAGEPLRVRVAVFNTGASAHDNAKGIDLLGGLIVADAASALRNKTGAAAGKEFQPPVIPPGGFFGAIVDLRDVVEGIDKPGRYTARFHGAGIEAEEAIPLVVIPRYDPAAAYRATVDTDYGRLSFDLLGREAPAHAHNFYDLANQGYYDDTLFHVVVKGVEVRGGDRTGDRTSSPGYGLGTEINSELKHRRGTLSMLRGRERDHGSQFVIALSDNSSADGRQTIFGELAEGQDTLAALENLPTTGQKEYPFYRPLKEIRIRAVRVEPAPAGSKATAEAKVTAPSAP